MIVVKKGDLVEFKPGLFGIEIPNNYGIFMRSYKNKKSKAHVAEIFTLKGKQETKQANLLKKNIGESVQLRGSNLPESKILNNQLKEMINRLAKKEKQLKKIDDNLGELTERTLWLKLTKSKLYDPEKSYSIEELSFVWYGLSIEDISKNRLKKMKEKLKESQTYGQGYFDKSLNSPNLWNALKPDDFKRISNEISILGSIRNKMFHMVEVQVEEAEDPEETELRKMPKEWVDISLTTAELRVFKKLQKMMDFHVENDSWPQIGMADTHVFSVGAFSIRTYLSHLAEDWVNEGRTSYSDAFVKLLIKTNYWTDTDALMAISRRVIKLADHFDWETDKRIEQLAEKFTEPSQTPGVFKNRTDLRNLLSYTIDPPTAKDFDDAISLEEVEYGYVLWVHIADVAHYVQKDTSLDFHARGRATSVYLPTKTLPMLPNHLSDNLCSLREQVPRLAMSVEIHYDDDGNKLLDHCKIHNSVIIVKQNLSYDFVNDAIKQEKQPFADFASFAELIQEHRKGLNLETDDVRLELGGQMAISTKTSSVSTKMIETFMVAANETVAEILIKNNKPVIFRNHPLPDKINVDRFNAHAKLLDLDYEIVLPNLEEEESQEAPSFAEMLNSSDSFGGNISFSLGSGNIADQLKEQLQTEKDTLEEEDGVDLGNIITKGLAQLSEELQEQVLQPFREAIREVEGIPEGLSQRLGYLTILKTLSRALYAAGNFGHFGLGSTAYVHFTSPIRRFPDIIAHRVCKAMIDGDDLIYTAEEIDELANHCTEQSEIAEKLERTIVGAGFSFLSKNPDYSFNREGIVASISGGGVFVLLPNGIEARIPLSNITTRKTFVDEYESMCFVGFRSSDHISEELTVDNWRDLLSDNSDEEPVEVLLKLGDRVQVDFVSWNHIEGRVSATPVSTGTSEETT